jgi:hypothetical protein
MKIFSFVLMLAASMVLVVGCSDMQNSPVSPSQQTVSTPGSPTSLAKKPVAGGTITDATFAYWYDGSWTNTPSSVWIQITWVPVVGAKSYRVEYTIDGTTREWVGYETLEGWIPVYTPVEDGLCVATFFVGPGGWVEPKTAVNVGSKVDITVTAFRNWKGAGAGIVSTSKTIDVTKRIPI